MTKDGAAEPSAPSIRLRGRRLLFLVTYGAVVASALVIAVCSLPIVNQRIFTQVEILDNARIVANQQNAFIHPLAPRHLLSGWLLVLADGASGPASNLRLYENGRELGPAHSIISRIQQEGGGAYSHWGQMIVFSSSDSSDPRTNGRLYRAEFNYVPHASLAPVVWSILTLSAVGALGFSIVRGTLGAVGRVVGDSVVLHLFARVLNAVERFLSAKTGMALLVLLFAAHAFASFVGLWRGIIPTITLGGDPAMAAAVAVADAEPDSFARDFLFSQKSNYAFYFNVNVWFMNVITRYTNLDLGSAFHALVIPTQLFHFLGFFLLGRKVLRSALGALLFTIACSFTVYPVFAGDFWGLWQEPQPRFTYAAVMPFLLLLGLGAGDKVVRWSLTFLAAGLATYLHPASGPAVALALMVGMAVKVWPSAPIRHTICLMFLSGMIYVVIFAPFAVPYLKTIANAGRGVDGAEALIAAGFGFGEEYIDLGRGILNAILNTWPGVLVVIPVSAVMGCWIVWRYGHDQRDEWRLLVGFVAGLFFISCIVPLVEHTIAALRGTYVWEFDVVRSIRYFIPVTLLFGFWGVYRLPRVGPVVRPLLAAAITVLWLVGQTYPQIAYRYSYAALQCWGNGSYFCEVPSSTKDWIELLEFAKRKVPRSSTFLSPEMALPLRFFARQPIAFHLKDFGFLAYSNHKQMAQSVRLGRRYRQIWEIADQQVRTRALMDLAKEVGADYLLLTGQLSPEFVAESGSIVLHNGHGILIDVRP